MKTKNTTVITLAQTQNTWLGIPGIEITPRGRLIVTWYSGGPREPDSDNKIFLQTSDDGGKTFTAPAIVVDPPGRPRAYDPTLWRDPAGVLWLIYNQGNPDTAEHGIFAIRCLDPDAKELTWTEPRRLGFSVPHSYRMNKPTVLSSGRWLMPVTFSHREVRDWFDLGAELQGVGLSDDHGRTWTLCGEVYAPKWALENMIVENKNGTVEMYIRAGDGRIWKSTSADAGQTWSEGEPTAIPNPGTRFYVATLASGRRLLINTPNPTDRTGLEASLSDDDGRTWSKGLVLDDREKVSYPDAAQAADGTIWAIWDRDRYGVGEVLITSFREEDIF